MHAQSMMQLPHGQPPPHSQQQHVHSLTGFMRQINQGGAPVNGMASSNSGFSVNISDDVFGDLPDEDRPLPGTPSHSDLHDPTGAMSMVDQMMSANNVNVGNNLGVHRPNVQSDSFAQAVVLD